MEQPQAPARSILRYSSAFKRKVVGEIENGQLTVAEARNLYEIRGSETVQKWLKRFGKHHLLTRTIRIEMKDEVSRIKAQEKKIQELQAALSEAHLKIVVLESTVAVLEQGQSQRKKKDVATSSSKRQ